MDLEAWRSVFSFASHVLTKPARGGKKHNLTSIIKKRINSKMVDPLQDPLDPDDIGSAPSRRKDPASALASVISAKIEDGNIRAAVRIISSDDKPAIDNEVTFDKLVRKHPAAPRDRRVAADPALTTAMQVTDAEVNKAIRSFPAGSSGGPDGLRPQHILDMITNKESGTQLLASITLFVNTLLSGRCHPAVTPILFGGNLVALEKKSGDVRPIAIGYSLRRIAAKCANTFATAKLKDYFNPTQLGVGVAGGCEAAVHATRRFLTNPAHDTVVAKLDFSNAFNSLHRDAMSSAVFNKIPEIYKFFHLAYNSPSILKYHNRQILSQEGAQQGDPLGALLFCLTIHPLLSTLSSPLVLGYMDDVTVGGASSSVLTDCERVRVGGEALGLVLNVKKCELIHQTGATPDTYFKDFIHLEPKQGSLLGAPILQGPAMDEALGDNCDELTRALARLQLLTAHDAIILLRASFSAPKVMHTLRSAPCTGHLALDRFDSLLRQGLSNIVNVALSDQQWIQASLPVKDGGLGLRRVASLAPSAFLASAASTRPLQDQILSKCPSAPGYDDSEIKTAWAIGHSLPCPADAAASNQHAWDRPRVLTDIASLQSSACEARDKARLLAVTAPHSGDWLHALPISSCGLRLDDEAIRIAIGLRLGTNLCEPHPCPCGENVDCRGTHGLSCRRDAGRVVRHHNINDLLCRAFTRAGIPTAKEPSGLFVADGKRPDGMTLIPWTGGKCLTWDVTVVDTLAKSHLSTSSASQGGAAESAAAAKEAKYSDLPGAYTFAPVAFETLGPICSSGTLLLNELGRRISVASGDPRERSFLYQRISVTIQRYNAISFRGSFIQPTDSNS